MSQHAMLILALFTLAATSCVAPVDRGCTSDDHCSTGRTCYENRCTNLSEVDTTPASSSGGSSGGERLECDIVEYNGNDHHDGRCDSWWVCDEDPDGGAHSVTCRRNSDGSWECKCSVPNLETGGDSTTTITGPDVGQCDDSALMTPFANDHCGWNIEVHNISE